MPEQSDLDRRFAAARADAADAATDLDRETVRASEELLNKLKRQSVDRRFKELGKDDLSLIPSHRRELVDSIRTGAIAKPRSSAPTATRWEVFRSRARYRVFPLGVAAVASLATIVLLGLAIHHTPGQWVEINVSQAFLASETLPDGSVTSARMDPGARFALTKIVGDQGELRVWVAGAGYATLLVPTSYLRTAQ